MNLIKGNRAKRVSYPPYGIQARMPNQPFENENLSSGDLSINQDQDLL